MRIQPLISLITLVVCVQLFLSPIAVLAQSSPSDDDAEIKRRKELAAALEAEAKARKAAADATSAELGLIKSNTTVEGTFVENNIAASKALGCAANDIKLQIDELRLGSSAVIVLNSLTAMGALSEYTALKTQLDEANTEFEKVLAEFQAKLDAWLKAENQAAEKRKKELEEKIKKMEEEIAATKPSRAPAGVTEKSTTSTIFSVMGNYKTLMVDADKTKAANDSISAGLSAAGAIAAVADPVTAALSVALNVMALFKTDVAMKGTSVTPQQMEIENYVYRLLTFEAIRNGNTITLKKRDDAPLVISPDRVALTNATIKNSGLLSSIRNLSVKYVAGKKMIELSGAKRKLVVTSAAEKEGKKEAELAVKIEEKRGDEALDNLAKDPSDRVLRAKYDIAVAKLAKARLDLDAIQKKVDEQAAAFDKAIALEKNKLEALISWSEAVEKRFSAAADQRSFGDLLRYEVLSGLLAGKKNVLWLETVVSANGANQRRLSSPIIDVFTRGPGISYSGGAVVGYQLRNSDGSIVNAGTVWAYAPYRKSKNIRIFECQGMRKNGDTETPFRDF
ncbi:MAG: hypothetical protein KF736_04355 [Acidobacteria bacterium]|nr:hypothetical protein [Acidobacteriota bacterium]MCW5948385.1 hypothetical protein [Pyrinomonadaceae bacterium]